MNSISRNLAGSLLSELGNVELTGNTLSALHFPCGENMFPLLTPCRETSVSSFHPHHFERCLSQSSSGYWLFTYCPSMTSSTSLLLNGAGSEVWELNLSDWLGDARFCPDIFIGEEDWKYEFHFHPLSLCLCFLNILELIVMNGPSKCPMSTALLSNRGHTPLQR